MRLPPKRDLLFVGTQLLLFVALAFAHLPDWKMYTAEGTGLTRAVSYLAWVIAAGCVVYGVVAVLQLGTSLTPWPSPKANSRLITTGIYAWARHPIYASLCYFACALAVATGSWWRLLVAVALFVLFYFKSAYEEKLLRQVYPEYATYAASVPRFGPKLGRG